MTSTQKKLTNFKNALRPNHEMVERKMATILDMSFVSPSEKGIIREVDMVRILSPNLKKYFYHIGIHLSNTENLASELLKQICHDYLELNGFNQHQFIMFRYDDVDNTRIIILVTRIGYDGKVISDGYDHSRSERVVSQLRRRYNLKK